MRNSLKNNSTCILNKYWQPTLEIKVDRTSVKTFASVSKEAGPVLVTRVLNKETLNTHKKLLPVRPKTALEIRKKTQKEWQLQSVLRYTQTQ